VVEAKSRASGIKPTALISARVMRGESLASFPYRGITKTRLLVNRQAAEAVGLRIPESVARRAEPWRRNSPGRARRRSIAQACSPGLRFCLDEPWAIMTDRHYAFVLFPVGALAWPRSFAHSFLVT